MYKRVLLQERGWSEVKPSDASAGAGRRVAAALAGKVPTITEMPAKGCAVVVVAAGEPAGVLTQPRGERRTEAIGVIPAPV